MDQILPRVHNNAVMIVGLAFGILALGFVLLYRAKAEEPASPKEANERRRR
jgi:hypothetical protein